MVLAVFLHNFLKRIGIIFYFFSQSPCQQIKERPDGKKQEYVQKKTKNCQMLHFFVLFSRTQKGCNYKIIDQRSKLEAVAE